MTIDECIILCENQISFSNEEYQQLVEWLKLLKWYEQGMKDIPIKMCGENDD